MDSHCCFATAHCCYLVKWKRCDCGSRAKTAKRRRRKANLVGFQQEGLSISYILYSSHHNLQSSDDNWVICGVFVKKNSYTCKPCIILPAKRDKKGCKQFLRFFGPYEQLHEATTRTCLWKNLSNLIFMHGLLVMSCPPSRQKYGNFQLWWYDPCKSSILKCIIYRLTFELSIGRCIPRVV